jgi:hypothetical protein
MRRHGIEMKDDERVNKPRTNPEQTSATWTMTLTTGRPRFGESLIGLYRLPTEWFAVQATVIQKRSTAKLLRKRCYDVSLFVF